MSVWSFDWQSLLVPKLPLSDVLLRTVLVYILLQLGLRSLGRKSLQPSASYHMVTLFLIGAFGGRAVLGEDTSLTSCALGLSTVLGLNALTSLAIYRSRRFATFFEGPAVCTLVEDGQLIDENLRRTRCSKDMLLAQLRGKGHRDLGQVQYAYMERTGEVTFIFR